MAFNDGLTYLLMEAVENASKAGEVAMKAFEKTIDDETDEVFNAIYDRVPEGTGKLKESLKKKKELKRKGYYGYEISFEGYNDDNGVAYAVIANTLNSGRVAEVKSRQAAIAGTHFVDKAISKLCGLDDRIEENVNKALEGLV